MGGAAATLLSRQPLPPSPRPVAVEVGSPMLTTQLQRRCSSSARTPHYLHRLTLTYDLLVLCLDPAASSLAPWVPLPPPEFIPGRVHVACAIVGAGYVDNLKQAFSSGSEPDGESVVQLICRTGGIAVLAHLWALKNPVPVIKDLKGPGLHAIVVYRSDGKLSGLSDLADAYELLKLGGSDYHGRDDKEEPDIGSFDLPVLAFSRFLEIIFVVCAFLLQNWRKQMILRLRFSRRNLQKLSSVTEAARRLLNNGQKSPPISTDTVWFV